VRVARIRTRISQAALRRVGAQATGRQVTATTRKVFNRARVLSPWDTGNMRGEHTMTVTAQPAANRVVGRVSVRTDYAMAVHEGTRAHVIRPNRRKALRFRYRGRTVIVRQVRHPGTQGRPWLATALREVALRDGFAVRR